MKTRTADSMLDISHRSIQVKKDVALAAWLFGDSLPGPIVRVRVVQTVTFSSTIRSNGSTISKVGMGTNIEHMKAIWRSIDFHAAPINPEDEYRSIAPGGTTNFTRTANFRMHSCTVCNTAGFVTHHHWYC